MTHTNQQFCLASRPTGLPTRETWEPNHTENMGKLVPRVGT
jgi:hypothetical protein